MAMNLVRTGSAALVGLGSGALNNAIVPATLHIAGIGVGYDAILEIGALAAGMGLQAFMPQTLPNLADGLVDGGIALTARRLSVFGVLALSNKNPTNVYAAQGMRASPSYAPYRINGAMYGGVHHSSPRGANTTLSGLARARAH